MLLIVFITNCHVSEKAKIGPVTSQPATKPPAMPKAHGRPLLVAASDANFENQCSSAVLAIVGLNTSVTGCANTPSSLHWQCSVRRPCYGRNASNNCSEPSRHKVFRNRHGCHLVSFQGNLLCQHNVARDETVLGNETPACSRPAGMV